MTAKTRRARVKAALPVNRVVVLLTPVFVGLSGWVTELAAKYLPGHPKLNSGELSVLMAIGAGAAVGVAVTWLRGWQLHERTRANHQRNGD